MRPPLYLTSRHQMASLSQKKMGKFQKQPELKKNHQKREKLLTGKHGMIGVNPSLQVELTSINAKKIAVDSVLFKKTIFVEF